MYHSAWKIVEMASVVLGGLLLRVLVLYSDDDNLSQALHTSLPVCRSNSSLY
jgi:hypothetical protein